jgi:hypothetical protein
MIHVQLSVSPHVDGGGERKLFPIGQYSRLYSRSLAATSSVKKDDIAILIWFGKSANNNCKRNGAANRKILKKEKCRKYLQHHALSFKRCLFNLLL